MADDETPDPAKIMKLARQATRRREYRKKFHVADFWGQAEWYEPQLRFFAAGAKHHQRLDPRRQPDRQSVAVRLRGRAAHDRPISEMVDRPALQQADARLDCRPRAHACPRWPAKKLTAMQGEFGTGTDSARGIRRQADHGAGRHRLDRYHVRRARDGRRQGRRIDRDIQNVRAGRRENAGRIASTGFGSMSAAVRGDLQRAVARTTATDGILFLSYTPLKGGGELTYRFLNEYSPRPHRHSHRRSGGQAHQRGAARAT